MFNCDLLPLLSQNFVFHLHAVFLFLSLQKDSEDESGSQGLDDLEDLFGISEIQNTMKTFPGVKQEPYDEHHTNNNTTTNSLACSMPYVNHAVDNASFYCPPEHWCHPPTSFHNELSSIALPDYQQHNDIKQEPLLPCGSGADAYHSISHNNTYIQRSFSLPEYHHQHHSSYPPPPPPLLQSQMSSGWHSSASGGSSCSSSPGAAGMYNSCLSSPTSQPPSPTLLQVGLVWTVYFKNFNLNLIKILNHVAWFLQ